MHPDQNPISQSPETVVRSPSMVRIFHKADLLSTNQASVLIYGESGTGKNHLAGYIQSHGPLAQAPFVCIHCNAIPPELFASELFGYFPNAFTGASNKGKTGLLEMANHGTVLFDEINELSPQNQTLLLHFLQNRTITPLGSLKAKEIHARIICTSGRDLREMIDQGTFRLDLYYRICVANIRIPPLRERREEIPWFITYFLDKYADIYPCSRQELEISQKKLKELSRLDWMGNIREIENFAQKLCLSEAPGQAIDDYICRFQDFHHSVLETAPAKNPPAPAGPVTRSLKEALRDFERSYIQAAIQETGSLQEAAARLGISYSSLCRKKAQYGIAAGRKPSP
ncbi:MAG: sigma 54-interacting transcriptional regulator [Lachnospiraceae bacterium]|nr:sigma 54-interacting transcriptional regulator [Lachnospiraceae bacterium]